MNKLIFIITLGMFALAACTKPAPQTKKITEKDTGAQIELRIGDTLEISLAGNATTGYLWEVTKLDEKIIKQAGEADYKPESNLAGAPGMATIRFSAVAAGNTTVELAYRRPWEKDKPPEKLFQLKVNVK